MSTRDRLSHRAQWLVGAKALAFGLVSPPKVDPVMVALRAALSPVGGVMADVEAEVLADAAKRHEVEVFAVARVPELARCLRAEVEDRRRTAAILELAQAELSRHLVDFQAAWLKGAVTWRLYPEGAYRTRRDMDLLVGDGIAEVRLSLLSRGWNDAVTPRRAVAGPLAVRAWPMTKSYGPFGVSLDLHRQVGHAWCRMDAKAVLADAVDGATSPEDTFLTTLSHLVESGFHEPMKGWVDLAWLAERIDVARLVARARWFGMEAALWLADHVLARWFPGGTRIPVRLGARRELLAHLAAGDHDTPERQPLYKGLSQRLWRTLLTSR